MADLHESGSMKAIPRFLIGREVMVFLSLWLRNPLGVAALNPSSARLADAVARCVEFSRPGQILELGAGTGSLTRGLLRTGCPAERIIALEREPRFAALLRHQFPKITVIEDDATRVGEYLSISGTELCTVISGLPIKWFALETQRVIVDSCMKHLGTDGQFIQITNAFISPLPIDKLGIAGHEMGRIWLNILPTQIWSYSRFVNRV